MWSRCVQEIVLALDTDDRGQEAWRTLARLARLRGKGVAFWVPEAYGRYKDINEAWIAGVLNVERKAKRQLPQSACGVRKTAEQQVLSWAGDLPDYPD